MKKGSILKRILVITLIIAIVALAGCSGGGKPAENGSGDPDGGETIDIIVSHNHPENSPEHEGIAAFKEIVEEKTNGAVNVKIYKFAVGQHAEQTEATQVGTIQITQQPTAVMSTFVPAYELVDFPYLWPDADTALEVLNGKVGELISAEAEKKVL